MRMSYRWSSVLLAAALLSSCSPAAQVPANPATTGVATVEATQASEPLAIPANFAEAPSLSKLSQAGSLPAVAQRIPGSPVVVRPSNEVGSYGGTLRFGFVGRTPSWGALWFIDGWENMVSWKSDLSGVQPNIVESWESSADTREYTFKLRKGMKWSDGQPFTADDILFYIDDILFNPEITTNGPIADWLPQEDADQFKAVKIDDYTVKFVFPHSYGTFLYNLASFSGRQIPFYPKHYLQQFHKKYNPNVDELVAAAGKENWVELFNQKASNDVIWDDPERPSLFAWLVTEPLGDSNQISLTRNPYYWKVDTQGNQLPYIDELLGFSYQDDENRTFAMSNGDLDMIKDPGASNMLTYISAMDVDKPIRVYTNHSDGANTLSIQFNQTISDTVKAFIFADKNFRVGMSYAINRQQIIDLAYFGQGDPAQVGPLENSPLYVEKLAKQYIEYDVAQANLYLDKVMPKKDADGYRLGLNGKRFTFDLFVRNDLSYGSGWVQIAEMLIDDWANVGVDVKLRSIPEAEFNTLVDQNVVEGVLGSGEGGAGISAMLDPRNVVPMEYNGYFGNGWSAWRLKSASRVQVIPPAHVLAMRGEYDAVIALPDQEQQVEAMKKLLEKSAEDFWVIGIARPSASYDVFSTRVGNIPNEWTTGWLYGVQKIILPEQWYIKAQ
ncbi:ABC transporter substrate-binding protein [Chloroflexia bacterium SDU3-3]|nr:ABC transporter substrate-binding protein [Chloroflexia bacterium SDU3-3]